MEWGVGSVPTRPSPWSSRLGLSTADTLGWVIQAVLFTIRCLVASLTSTRYMPVAAPSSDTQKCL